METFKSLCCANHNAAAATTAAVAVAAVTPTGLRLERALPFTSLCPWLCCGRGHCEASVGEKSPAIKKSRPDENKKQKKRLWFVCTSLSSDPFWWFFLHSIDLNAKKNAFLKKSLQLSLLTPSFFFLALCLLPTGKIEPSVSGWWDHLGMWGWGPFTYSPLMYSRCFIPFPLQLWSHCEYDFPVLFCLVCKVQEAPAAVALWASQKKF